MELRRFLVLAFAVTLLTVGALLLFLPRSPPLPDGSQTLPYRFSVADGPGIDAGTDVFRLGQVAPGGVSWRTLSIENTITSIDSSNQTVRRARVYAVGNGARWLSIEPSLVTLPASVKVTLQAPQTAEKGLYKGVLVVEPLPPE